MAAAAAAAAVTQPGKWKTFNSDPFFDEVFGSTGVVCDALARLLPIHEGRLRVVLYMDMEVLQVPQMGLGKAMQGLESPVQHHTLHLIPPAMRLLDYCVRPARQAAS